MKTTQFQQRAKVGVAGSFQNQIMGNNSTTPVVGEYATKLHYSDRTCYKVIEVSDDLKTVKLESLNAEHDKSLPGGEGHQNWILKPSGNFSTIVWKNNKWRFVGSQISFTKEFRDQIYNKYNSEYIGITLRKFEPELADKIYEGEVMPKNVIEGITKKKITYSPVSIIFGKEADYYYDWEF